MLPALLVLGNIQWRRTRTCAINQEQLSLFLIGELRTIQIGSANLRIEALSSAPKADDLIEGQGQLRLLDFVQIGAAAALELPPVPSSASMGSWDLFHWPQ